ncbi:hypothetical protein F5Y08DRAFT_324578 [Xylaria arbuscula]|nr:hypothetical protein F5Y08DRAFT_324578 [Xylaria arbuscula]
MIEYSQAIYDTETAGYMMLSNYKDDAICIAATYTTETHTSTAWYGDYGYTCGMSWGLSKEEIGAKVNNSNVSLLSDHSSHFTFKCTYFKCIFGS